ncbi:MAG: argininosuccinate lyase [Planctomycetota bacterium]|nr:MAG: argininosuccinate lyase [Planctomycetota bacterium]
MKNKKNSGPMWAIKSTNLSQLNLRYTSDRDVTALPMADEILTPYDIQGTIAHVKQLNFIKILKQTETNKIIKSLKKAYKLHQSNKFPLNPDLEDIHMNLEAFVSSKKECGQQLGGRMHTARSRNDQAATAMRLYMRDMCLQIQSALIKLVEKLLIKGLEHSSVLMAGITHHQNAVLSSLGHLYYSYAQSLIRDIQRFEEAFDVINVSPLGAVAGYGTTWPLDRNYSAKLLNFDDVLSNTIDCVTNRWEPEAELSGAICFMMNHLSTISQDIIFCSTSSNPALQLPVEFTTGSSVMPQKRNPDFAEATKGRTALIHGAHSSLLSIGKGNVSGYNKDTQWTKYLIMDTINTAKDAPEIFENVINKIKPNKERLFQQTQEGFLSATDLADALVREGKIPFRTSYLIIKEITGQCKDVIDYENFSSVLKKHDSKIKFSKELFEQVTNPSKSITLKNHNGGPAPAAIKKLKTKLSSKLNQLIKINKKNKLKVKNALNF